VKLAVAHISKCFCLPSFMGNNVGSYSNLWDTKIFPAFYGARNLVTLVARANTCSRITIPAVYKSRTLVTQVTIFCKVIPNIGGSSVWKLLHGTFLAFRILRWLLDFWTIFRSVKSKGKSKVHPRTGHEDPEGEQMYSSIVPSTSALDGGGWSMHPRPLYPGKDLVPIL